MGWVWAAALSACVRAPAGPPITAAVPPPAAPAAEAPTGRSRAHALEAELAAARGDHARAAAALGRASFEDPGSAALLLRWAEEGLRAGDPAAIDAARARAARGRQPAAVRAALDALAEAAAGAPADPLLQRFAAAHPPGSSGGPEAAAALLRALGAAAPGGAAALCPGAPAGARLPGCPVGGALRVLDELDELEAALRDPAAAADPLRALWLADRRWTTGEAPQGEVLAATLAAAAAAGDTGRWSCWTSLAATDPRGPAPPGPRYAPPPAQAAPEATAPSSAPLPSAARRAELTARAGLWSPCPARP